MYALTPFERRGWELFDAFHELENSFFRSSAPAAFGSFRTDIRDEGDKFVMEAELPGFDRSDIKLDVCDNRLTLTAEHCSDSCGDNCECGCNDEQGEHKENSDCGCTESAEPKRSQGRYIRRERCCGSYKRSFSLDGINSDEISAEYKNGILTVTLPKTQPQQPQSRRLEIR